ncbi:MAG: CGLD27 family protein [Cyanobacteriota bacterium]|nr:CGLD27 family protein [Cyanobacteriota bacterium]MED5383374.1 CGLD27 family protein [Cyanobacteriota bacterium]
MVEAVACPVPPEQRPLEEFEQLSRSWFFSWPAGEFPHLRRALLISWLMLLPLSTLVASGSWTLRNDPARLVAAGAVAALVLPLLLLMRQWLGWTYVMKRLLAETVDYEESGWYDGQIWEKPLSWRERDLLVARYEVRPILGRLSRAMALATGLILGGASLCQAL